MREQTRNMVIQYLIFNYVLDLQSTLKIRTAHRVIIFDSCALLFVHPIMGSKDIERKRNTAIQC